MGKEIKQVEKKWGKEKWLANDGFCCKELWIKKGHQCSLHYHKNKDELFYIVSGPVYIECGKDKKTYSPGQWVRVKPAEIHRFRAINDALIIECSTHHEDCDSHRIEGSK